MKAGQIAHRTNKDKKSEVWPFLRKPKIRDQASGLVKSQWVKIRKKCLIFARALACQGLALT